MASTKKPPVQNLKFRKQHLIEGYLLDFYCYELRLAIEIDGPIHSRQIADDQVRQKLIEHFNIKFFRVKSSEVERDLEGVLKRLEEFITLILSSPAHSSRDFPHPALFHSFRRGRGKKE